MHFGQRISLLALPVLFALPWVEVRLYPDDRDHQHYGEVFWEQSGFHAMMGECSSQMQLSNSGTKIPLGQNRFDASYLTFLFFALVFSSLVCALAMGNRCRKYAVTTGMCLVATLTLLPQMNMGFSLERYVKEMKQRIADSVKDADSEKADAKTRAWHKRLMKSKTLVYADLTISPDRIKRGIQATKTPWFWAALLATVYAFGSGALGFLFSVREISRKATAAAQARQPEPRP